MIRRAVLIVCLAGAIALPGVSIYYPAPVVASFAFTLAAVVVLGGVTIAFLCHGRSAAFWRAFALISALYLVASTQTETLLAYSRGVSQVIADESPPVRLPSTRWLAAAYDLFGGEPIETSAGTPVPAPRIVAAPPAVIPMSLDLYPLQRFLTTGHSVLAVLLGAAAGAIASMFAGRDDARRQVRRPQASE
jgi:hypothetical protein